jgi:hypothetical protein
VLPQQKRRSTTDRQPFRSDGQGITSAGWIKLFGRIVTVGRS